jgi:hypothetical protein
LVILFSKPFYQTNITIYSLNGLKLYSSKIYISNSEIDMSNYPAGIYIVKIISMKDIFIKKIIKQ